MLIFYYPEREQPRPRTGSRRFKRSGLPIIELKAGRNSYSDSDILAMEEDSIWEILKSQDAIKFKAVDSDPVEADEPEQIAEPEEPEPEEESESVVEVPPVVEESTEEAVTYVPLTPTTSELTAINGIGPITAAEIIANTPTGGYLSPAQLITLNALSIAFELIATLFEIVAAV